MWKKISVCRDKNYVNTVCIYGQFTTKYTTNAYVSNMILVKV